MNGRRTIFYELKQKYSENLQTNVDVSDIRNIKICFHDICLLNSKLLKSLRLALRNRLLNFLTSLIREVYTEHLN